MTLLIHLYQSSDDTPNSPGEGSEVTTLSVDDDTPNSPGEGSDSQQPNPQQPNPQQPNPGPSDWFSNMINSISKFFSNLFPG